MPGEGTVRAITDLVARLRERRPDSTEFLPAEVAVPEADPVFPTKALCPFLACLDNREAPVVLDLGPVVGSNVTFLGERLACKIFVEDLFTDLERFARQDAEEPDAVADFLKTRFSQSDGSVDGILCWDLIDYFDRPAAQVLAGELARVLRPGGALLGFFATTGAANAHYTKYEIVDDRHLRHRPHVASHNTRRALLSRDIIRMFEGLVVAESFLLKIHTREMLFRKPAAGAAKPTG